MGLGISPFLANRLANTPTNITAGGTSLGSAAKIGPFQQLVVVTGTNGGSGLRLPQVAQPDTAGQDTALLGDDFTVLNLLGATIQVYASGSTTIYVTGQSATGTTGVGIDPGFQGAFLCVSATTWTLIKASA
jgi:hypothetical protein